MAKSGTQLGPIDLSSFLLSSVFKRPSVVFRCTPQPPLKRYLVAKSSTHLGPVDLSSDVPPMEAFSGQEWYYIGSS